MAGAPTRQGYEGENPTRRYKSFRPRQAARGYFNAAVPTNWGTVYLYNDSTAAQLIVVRGCWAGFVTGNPALGYQVQGKTGTLIANATHPIVAGGAKLPGSFYSDDLAAQFTDSPIFVINGITPVFTRQDIITVLLPGWSFAMQSTGTATSVEAFLLWEAIFADELDFMW
jgi:hypothetical protein